MRPTFAVCLLALIVVGLSCSSQEGEEGAEYEELLSARKAEKARLKAERAEQQERERPVYRELLRERMAERARIKAERDARFVWGKTVRGLRAAIELVPEKEFYEVGERVGVCFHIENVSDGYIQISSLSRREDVVIARDGRGRRVEIMPVAASADPPRVRRYLAAGEGKVLASCGLGFGHADGTTGREYWKGNVLCCGPGEYTISYRLGLSEKVCSLDGKQCITYPGDWRGTLAPGVRKVTVVEREGLESGG